MAAVDFLEPAEEEGGGGGAGGAKEEEQQQQQPPLKLPKLPHATQGIVEDDPLQNINYLTKNSELPSTPAFSLPCIYVLAAPRKPMCSLLRAQNDASSLPPVLPTPPA